MARERIRELTKRVRTGIAQHNPMKAEQRTSEGEGPGAARRANSVLNTGPRVPPQRNASNRRR